MAKFPLPKGVQEVRAKGGSTIPMVFVTTADAEKGLEAVTYKALSSDMRKAVKTVKTNLEDKEVVGAPAEDAPAEEATDDAASKVDFSTWTNSEGKTITAMPLSTDGIEVSLRLQNGKTVKYPLSKLSEESREKLTAYFDGE